MSIDPLDEIRIVSVILALLAIIPSVRLLKQIIKETTFVNKEAKATNILLRVLFVFFIGMVFINAAISLMAVCGSEGFIASNHWILNTRTLGVNAGVLGISTAMDMLSRKIFEKK